MGPVTVMGFRLAAPGHWPLPLRPAARTASPQRLRGRVLAGRSYTAACARLSPPWPYRGLPSPALACSATLGSSFGIARGRPGGQAAGAPEAAPGLRAPGLGLLGQPEPARGRAPGPGPAGLTGSPMPEPPPRAPPPPCPQASEGRPSPASGRRRPDRHAEPARPAVAGCPGPAGTGRLGPDVCGAAARLLPPLRSRRRPLLALGSRGGGAGREEAPAPASARAGFAWAAPAVCSALPAGFCSAAAGVAACFCSATAPGTGAAPAFSGRRGLRSCGRLRLLRGTPLGLRRLRGSAGRRSAAGGASAAGRAWAAALAAPGRSWPPGAPPAAVRPPAVGQRALRQRPPFGEGARS